MNRTILTTLAIALFVFGIAPNISHLAYATDCASVPVSGNYTVSATCTFASSPVDGLVSSCPTNSAVLTISTTGHLSVLASQTIAVGSVSVSAAGGSIVIVDGGQIKLNSPIYVTDADNDGYPAYGTDQATSGSTCRTSETSVTSMDCGDGSATANPGQTTAQSTTFTNTQNAGLTHDWNCDGVETKTYGESYTCSSCNNGTYTSRQNLTSGFASAVACGSSSTYFTVTSATCLAGSGNVTCPNGTDNTQATVTQTCL